MIKFYGEKLNSTTIEFLNVYSFEFNSKRNIPANSFYIDLAFSEKEYRFCDFYKVKVMIDDSEVFSGFVDTEEDILSIDGHFLRLNCRNQASLLLDNEIKPKFYFKLTSNQVFNDFAKPFGIKAINFPFQSTKNFLQIKKGSSYFNLIDEFCVSVYNKRAFLNSENIIVLEPFTKKLHTISKKNSAIKKISYKKNRQELYSKVFLKTATTAYDNEYDFSFDNDLATQKKVIRQRFYNPISTFSKVAKNECQELIRKSNLRYFSIEITFIGEKLFEVGDNVSIDFAEFKGEYYVDEVTLYGNSKEITTTISLRDKKYV